MKKRRAALAFILVLSFIGLLDSVYLAAAHFRRVTPKCTVIGECEIVTTSKYATIGQIPVALLGVIFYLTIFIATVAFLDTQKNIFLKAIRYEAPFGFFASLIFLYIQAFVLRALCEFCLLSAVTATGVFLASLHVNTKEN